MNRIMIQQDTKETGNKKLQPSPLRYGRAGHASPWHSCIYKPHSQAPQDSGGQLEKSKLQGLLTRNGGNIVLEH